MMEARPWIQLYPAWVPADLPVPNVSALELFEAVARRRPGSPAIHYFDSTITYGALDRMAEALASALAQLGLAPGDRVALYLQNVPQFAIAQYAAWKVGGIVVPLNPMFKAAELAYHLNDSGAKVLIALESLYAETARRVVPQTSVRNVITTSELDFLPTRASVPTLLAASRKTRFPETLDLMELVRREAKELSPHRLRWEDIAYLTYTSGTTTQLDFFQTVQTDRVLGNMQAAGQIPAPPARLAATARSRCR